VLRRMLRSLTGLELPINFSSYCISTDIELIIVILETNLTFAAIKRHFKGRELHHVLISTGSHVQIATFISRSSLFTTFQPPNQSSQSTTGKSPFGNAPHADRRVARGHHFHKRTGYPNTGSNQPDLLSFWFSALP